MTAWLGATHRAHSCLGVVTTKQQMQVCLASCARTETTIWLEGQPVPSLTDLVAMCSLQQHGPHAYKQQQLGRCYSVKLFQQRSGILPTCDALCISSCSALLAHLCTHIARTFESVEFGVTEFVDDAAGL